MEAAGLVTEQKLERLCSEERVGCKPCTASSAAPTLCGPMMLVCPCIMFVRAVLKQIPHRIDSGVSSAQSYPSPPADRGIIPMGTV